MFRRGGSGIYEWESELSASDPTAYTRFGSAVDIQGAHAVVGRPEVFTSGGCYVFHDNGTEWTQSQLLKPPAGRKGSGFGAALELAADALVVGHYGASIGGDSRGAADVFDFDGVDFVLRQSLEALQPEDFAEFGAAVCLDEGVVGVGSPRNLLFGSGPGSALVFRDVGPPSVRRPTPGGGSASGGTRVFVRGRGFTPESVVRFDGELVDDVEFLGSGLLRVTVPAFGGGPIGPTGVAVDVSVETAAGGDVLEDGYVYLPYGDDSL